MLTRIIPIFLLLLISVLSWGKDLGDGIGNTSLTWTTGGKPSVPGENVNWSYCSEDGYNDKICVTSGGGGAGQASSFLKTTITGPCKISFHYKVQTYGGIFAVVCDNDVLYKFSEKTGVGVEWKYAEYDIPAGTHSFTLLYIHPGMGYSHQFNGVRIDNFKVAKKAPF